MCEVALSQSFTFPNNLFVISIPSIHIDMVINGSSVSQHIHQKYSNAFPTFPFVSRFNGYDIQLLIKPATLTAHK